MNKEQIEQRKANIQNAIDTTIAYLKYADMYNGHKISDKDLVKVHNERLDFLKDAIKACETVMHNEVDAYTLFDVISGCLKLGVKPLVIADMLEIYVNAAEE